MTEGFLIGVLVGFALTNFLTILVLYLHIWSLTSPKRKIYPLRDESKKNKEDGTT